jgi:hypothetical protein
MRPPTLEPGLDLHEWETRWAELEPELASPAEALPAVADVVETMLVERGLEPRDPVTADGVEREILDQFRAARDIADRLEQFLDVEHDDVVEAADGSEPSTTSW